MQFELSPGGVVQTRRVLARARAAYGDLPIDLRLRPVVAPSDPSALAEVWTYVGGIWVGTFARPLAQLPEQAELVLVAAPGRTFPAAERCLIELDFREDLVTIDPGSLGGLTEAVVAQLEFTESGVTLRGVGQREPDASPAAAAVRTALRGATPVPGLHGAVIAVDASASMRLPGRERPLRTLVECAAAVCDVVWQSSTGVRLVVLGPEPVPVRDVDELVDVLSSTLVRVGSSAQDPVRLAGAVRPGEVLLLATDDLPDWVGTGALDAGLRDRTEVVLVGYPGVVPPIVAGVSASSWSVVATESADALTLPVSQLLRVIRTPEPATGGAR